jgi:hypothetical protein
MAGWRSCRMDIAALWNGFELMVSSSCWLIKHTQTSTRISPMSPKRHKLSFRSLPLSLTTFVVSFGFYGEMFRWSVTELLEFWLEKNPRFGWDVLWIISGDQRIEIGNIQIHCRMLKFQWNWCLFLASHHVSPIVFSFASNQCFSNHHIISTFPLIQQFSTQ